MTRSHKPFDTEARLLTIYNLSGGGDVGVLECGANTNNNYFQFLICCFVFCFLMSLARKANIIMLLLLAIYTECRY